jgi:hypothetical protein
MGTKFSGVATLASVLLILGLMWLHVTHPGDGLVSLLLWIIIGIYIAFIIVVVVVVVLTCIAIVALSK